MGIHNTNLTGARTKISGFGIDLSRSYLFAIELPTIFGAATDITTMTVFCASSKVPDFKLGSKQLKFQNLDINLVNGVTFPAWEVTFLSDESNIIRSNLLAWSGAAWDYNRKGAATPISYKRIIKVHQLDRVGTSISQYTLCGAYPEAVDGYDIKNEGHDIVKFSTKFKYDYFTYNSNSLPYAQQPVNNSKPIDLEPVVFASPGAFA